jgi:type I restriction-modification system DNA methylase subunit/restriction endonuclease S subunit
MERTIDYIRNVFRSSSGITGMDSINHCIIFVTFRMMTPELCRTIGMDESLSFENAIHDKNGNILGSEELYSKFYCEGNKELNFIGQIVNRIGFSNFRYKLKSSSDLLRIVIKLKELDIENLTIKFDLAGLIYELHLKSGTLNARDLGQFYTHRLVIKYMIKLCDPKIVNGLVETIVDPCSGSGGFLSMSIKHLKEKYPLGIDWAENKNNIIGFDIDDNVKNLALLNVFLEIGCLCKDTIVRQNTLTNGLKFPNSGKVLEKADIILSNSPYGIKTCKFEKCCEKIKDIGIKATNAEILFIHLFMGSLADNGRCAIIIPDGILFNTSKPHIETRKHLVENFNLKKIISLKCSNAFLNTNVKTNILFFTKESYTTKNVEFCEIDLDEKGEITETVIINVSYSDIKIKNYSLSVNIYNVKKAEKIEGLSYKKIEDFCEFSKPSKRNASFGSHIGEYPFYASSSSGKSKFCSEADYKEKSVIIGSGGQANVKYDENFSCSSHNFILTTNKCNSKYLYYFFSCNLEMLESGFNGATIKNLSKEYVKTLEIPIPSISVQNAIVERLDFLTYTNETLKLNIEKLKTTMKYYIENAVQHVKQVEKLENIAKFLAKNKKLKASDGNLSGKYKFYTSSQNKIMFRDDYEFEHQCLIIGRGGNPSIHISKEFGISHDDCYVIKSKYDNYIYYFIMVNKEILEKGFQGATIKHISKSYINNIEIPIPSLEIQNALVEYCDNITNIIQLQEKQIESNKELMENIMNGYLSLCEKANNNEEEQENENSCSSSPISSSLSSEKEEDDEEEFFIIKNKGNLKVEEEDSEPITEEDLTKLTVDKLKIMCKNKNLGPYSKLKKAELITMLTNSK